MRSVLAIIMLLSLAGLSLWWLLSLQTTRQTDNAEQLTAPRLILENFQATRLNGQGVRQYTLSAPHLIQWPDQRGIEIEQPHMILYQEGRFELWQINAGQAWIAEDQRTVQLRDAVEAIRNAGDPAAALQINTSDLTYRPRDETIATDAPVQMTFPHGSMDGTGLRGQVDQQNYTLLSAVRGHYVAPP